MILSAGEIAKNLKSVEGGYGEDPLVITPSPDLDELSNSKDASVDLHLGTWFLTMRQRRKPHIDVMLQAPSTESSSGFTKSVYVPFQSPFYLHPGVFVLATTLEWVRLPFSLAGSIIGKSSFGRRGLIIETASLVHPGFTGCLTLELTNVGEIPLKLTPGIPIAQLVLQKVEGDTHPGARGSYVGFRRPTVGDISFDSLSKKIMNSPSP